MFPNQNPFLPSMNPFLLGTGQGGPGGPGGPGPGPGGGPPPHLPPHPHPHPHPHQHPPHPFGPGPGAGAFFNPAAAAAAAGMAALLGAPPQFHGHHQPQPQPQPQATAGWPARPPPPLPPQPHFQHQQHQQHQHQLASAGPAPTPGSATPFAAAGVAPPPLPPGPPPAPADRPPIVSTAHSLPGTKKKSRWEEQKASNTEANSGHMAESNHAERGHDGYASEFDRQWAQYNRGDNDGAPSRPRGTPTNEAAKKNPPREALSDQEKQFDLMFDSWEKNFRQWQEDNRDNPDRRYVEKHTRDMNEMRDKLLKRRETLRQQRRAMAQEQEQSVQPPPPPPSSSSLFPSCSSSKEIPALGDAKDATPEPEPSARPQRELSEEDRRNISQVLAEDREQRGGSRHARHREDAGSKAPWERGRNVDFYNVSYSDRNSSSQSSSSASQPLFPLATQKDRDPFIRRKQDEMAPLFERRSPRQIASSRDTYNQRNVPGRPSASPPRRAFNTDGDYNHSATSKRQPSPFSIRSRSRSPFRNPDSGFRHHSSSEREVPAHLNQNSAGNGAFYQRRNVSEPREDGDGAFRSNQGRFGQPHFPSARNISPARAPMTVPPPPPAPEPKGEVFQLEDIIDPPGRYIRPPKIVVIFRGLPGSGKSHIAKEIKAKEAEFSSDAPRILALDDYFEMDGEYEFEAALEASYRASLLKSFKKQIENGLFSFLIVDCINDKTAHYQELWTIAKQNGYEVYIAELECDASVCVQRNIHKRSEAEIVDLARNWESTPSRYHKLDMRRFLQSSEIETVDMEDVKESSSAAEKRPNSSGEAEADEAEDKREDDEETKSPFKLSKWEVMDKEEQLAQLDGVSSRSRKRKSDLDSIEDWLEISKDDKVSSAARDSDGKKRVRWADIEERRQQMKMRQMGFVVGQNWDRVMDPDSCTSALTRTKIIPNRFQQHE